MSNNKHSQKSKSALREAGQAIGVLAVSGVLILSGVIGSQAIIQGVQQQKYKDRVVLLAEQATNDTSYEIPNPNKPHWLLVYGFTYQDSKGKEYLLSGVDITAQYIHAVNPDIGFSIARDLILAENIAYQDATVAENIQHHLEAVTADGVQDQDVLVEEVEPFTVESGQEVRLPLEFGPIGEFVNPELDGVE